MNDKDQTYLHYRSVNEYVRIYLSKLNNYIYLKIRCPYQFKLIPVSLIEEPKITIYPNPKYNKTYPVLLTIQQKRFFQKFSISGKQLTCALIADTAFAFPFLFTQGKYQLPFI